MERICVYCGSSPGSRVDYSQAAIRLGEELAKQGIGLVYGGGSVGLMGQLAKTVFEHGGEVIGVIPQSLVDMEVAFEGLSDLRVVTSMHARKALMVELSDGFIALPGGLGTFEEFLEVLTWAQLGMHRKPCGLLNICNYYDRLIGFLDHALNERFIHAEHRSMVLIEEDPNRLLNKFKAYIPPQMGKGTWAKQLSLDRSSL